MKTSQLSLTILVFLIFFSCSKSNDSNQPTQIDVSQQWKFDALGNTLSGPGDTQWQSTTFTSQELGLFNSMDTANLTGTTTPSAVLHTQNFPCPNPFASSQNLFLTFPSGYTGPFVLKMVYVDSLMNPILKMSSRWSATAYSPPTPSGFGLTITPTILPTGRFRLYYTLSAASNPHFYKCWGNIQKQ